MNPRFIFPLVFLAAAGTAAAQPAEIPTAETEEQIAEAAAAVPDRIDLETALALALQHSYVIRQARARYAEATGAATEREAARLPTISIDTNYSRTDPHRLPSLNGQRFGSATAWDAGVTARQFLYAGGGVMAGVRASRATREAAAADLDTAVRAALVDVRQRYYDTLLARAQVRVQEEAVRLLEEELTTARSRVQAGTGSPFDQLRAEVALANGQPPLIRARNDYRLAAVELMRSIGLPSPEGVEDKIAGELSFSGEDYTLETLLGSAHANRPELHRLEQLVDAAKESVTVARATGRPNVSAFAGYGIQKSTFSDDLGDTLDGWAIGVQGSWPIFDGHATRGRVQQARARLEQAQLQYDETLLAIDTEVRQAFSTYREARELVIASRRVVDQATESLRLARSRFEAGAATQLDVLQAQVALTQARTNEAQAYHDANVALAQLERAAALPSVPEDTAAAAQLPDQGSQD